MLEFCPYCIEGDKSDLKKIKGDELAYEMVFYGNHTYEELEDVFKSIVDIKALIHEEEDAVLIKRYGEGTKRYFMPGPKSSGDKIGPQKLIELIQRYSGVQSPITDEVNSAFSEKSAFSGAGIAEMSDLENLYLECIVDEETGIYFINETSAGDETIAMLLPCCPKCRQRLPIGWLQADDYIGIGLSAPPGGGKTTFLISLYASLKNVAKYFGGPIRNVTWAHKNLATNKAVKDEQDIGTTADYYHEKRKLDARRLVEEQICPAYTDPNHLIAPAFLTVKIGCKDGIKNLIVGIYDNSGEVLNEATEDEVRIVAFGYRYAQIYFMEPKQFGIHDKEEHMQSTYESELLTIEEQGEMQKDEKSISGSELLQINHTEEQKQITPPMELLASLCQRVETIQDTFGRYPVERFYAQHLAMTIIKCDLLQEKGILSAEEEPLLSVEDTGLKTLWDRDIAKNENRKYEAVFKKMIGKQDLEKAESLLDEFHNGGGSCSWHVVSALGTRTEEYEPERFKLVGKYSPVRLWEPLATCIIKRIRENGWEN